MEINILGTKYEIIKNASTKDYPQLKKCDGFTDFSVKKIVVADFEKDENSIDDLEWYKNKVLRHEIVHAFLQESGLAENSDWARNEELIDWIAIQFEKILTTFVKVGAVEIVFPIKGVLSNKKSEEKEIDIFKDGFRQAITKPIKFPEINTLELLKKINETTIQNMNFPLLQNIE